MAEQNIILITCDKPGCREEASPCLRVDGLDPAEARAQLRGFLRTRGWSHHADQGDLCPKHSKAAFKSFMRVGRYKFAQAVRA